MKHNAIESIFAVDQRVKVIKGDYSGKEGVIQRLGAAGSVIYVHVLLDGAITVLTFSESHLE